MSAPEISVLMSCYNASQYLPEAIESILEQTYSNYELILVNDGSTDDTLKIIEEHASQDKRIKVVDKENTGLVDSLNVGLDIAQGEWIARLDADDLSLPDRLGMQLNFLNNHPSVALLGTGCASIDENGNMCHTYKYPQKHNALISRMCRAGSAFPHSSAMFLRKAAAKIGGYDPRFTRSQDIDMWLRLSHVGEVACLPEPLVKIREHSANVSNHDGGTISRIMSMAARICHILRLESQSDPSQDADNHKWAEFIQWLTERMDRDSYSESRRQWAHLKSNYSNCMDLNGKLIASLKLVTGLLSSGNACQIIRNKFFTSKLSWQLANEWIQLCSAQHKNL